MEIAIDTSALIAVIVGEPERTSIIEQTSGTTLIGPGSIPWEIGNAFSSMFKQKKITLNAAHKGLDVFHSIPIRYVEVDFSNALKRSKEMNLYAYDAYILDCAERFKTPLLTLDQKLLKAAKKLKIETVEI